MMAQVQALSRIGLGDVLNSSVWTALSALLAGVSLCVSIVHTRRQRERRALSYTITVRRLDRDPAMPEAWVIEARIENSGDLPILSSEFERPLSFHFEADAAPAILYLSATSRPELEPELGLRRGEVLLHPLLLNPGDWLALRFIVCRLHGEVSCRHRIVGIAQIDG